MNHRIPPGVYLAARSEALVSSAIAKEPWTISIAVGHLQGIIRMIEAKKSCPEVVQQMSAVIAAIESSRKVFLEDHIRGCILDAVRAKKPDDAFKELEHVLSLMS